MRRVYQRKKRSTEKGGAVFLGAAKTTENSRPHPLLRLQQAGNLAVQEWLHTQSHGPPAPISEGNVPEQEAVRLADNLALDHKGSAVVPRENAGTSPASCDATSQSIGEAIHSAGEPLDPAVRSEMEPHFECDFGRVRVHHNESANEAAAAVNADAFAAGSHLVFASGKYAPATQEGRRLLTHELVHVVQQEGRPAPHSQPAASSAPPPGRIQRQQALRLALPRGELRARANPDITALVDALPGVLMNGQKVTVMRVTAGGVTHVFTLTITITPGAPPISRPVTAETSEIPSQPAGQPGSQTWNHDITLNLFERIPDPVTTLFHELIHARLLIDKYLPLDRQSATFKRYQKSLGIARNVLLPERQAVIDRIAAIRKWYKTFVAKFNVPPALDAGAGDDHFYEFLVNEKFANQEANSRLTNEIIAGRYAASIQTTFAMAADAQGLFAERMAAENHTRGSVNLETTDDLVRSLSRAVTLLYGIIDTVSAAKEILPEPRLEGPNPLPGLMERPMH